MTHASEITTHLKKPQAHYAQFLYQSGFGLRWEWILLARCRSKWAEAASLPDKTANGIASFIYSVSLK